MKQQKRRHEKKREPYKVINNDQSTNQSLCTTLSTTDQCVATAVLLVDLSEATKRLESTERSVVEWKTLYRQSTNDLDRMTDKMQQLARQLEEVSAVRTKALHQFIDDVLTYFVIDLLIG